MIMKYVRAIREKYYRVADETDDYLYGADTGELCEKSDSKKNKGGKKAVWICLLLLLLTPLTGSLPLTFLNGIEAPSWRLFVIAYMTQFLGLLFLFTGKVIGLAWDRFLGWLDRKISG